MSNPVASGAAAETMLLYGYDDLRMRRTFIEDEATDEEQDALLAAVLERATRAGEEAVERTTEQLDVLSKAGVVDAGGRGFTLLLDALFSVCGVDGVIDRAEIGRLTVSVLASARSSRSTACSGRTRSWARRSRADPAPSSSPPPGAARRAT